MVMVMVMVMVKSMKMTTKKELLNHVDKGKQNTQISQSIVIIKYTNI